MNRLALWRARWPTWAPALLFFLLNLGGLILYRFAYADRIDVLSQRVARQQGRLQSLNERGAGLEKRVALARTDRDGIATLYKERFSTERERLTKTLAEFKTLATKAGLLPQSVSYPEQELAQFGLVKKSIVFGVDGDYNALRQLIHLLEISPTFLSVEEVRLTGDSGANGRLHIALRIATMFVNENAPVRALGAGAPAEAPRAATPSAPPAGSRPETLHEEAQ